MDCRDPINDLIFDIQATGNTPKKVEKQTEIDGICELKIIDRNSILIKRPKFDLLTLSKGEKTSLSETTISIGESFNLADADHISDTY